MLVSVVMPTFNYGRYIAAAVESVFAQTHRELELIVVDDGSTDDTAQKLERYRDRIHYIHQQNQGVVAARNTAIRASTGELIAFLDADDVWHPRNLELHVAYLKAHPQVSLTVAKSTSDMSGNWSDVELPLADRPIALDDVVLRCGFPTCGVVVRRECLDALGLFQTGLTGAEDRDLWIRIAANRAIVQIDARLCAVRLHGGKLSNRALRMEVDELEVLRRVFREIPALRGRWTLRQKAISAVYLSTAIAYDGAGLRIQALAKVLRSLLAWPAPLDRRTSQVPLLRAKRVAVITMRMLGLAKPDESFFPGMPQPAAAAYVRS